MLTLEKYTAHENNIQEILDGGKNIETGTPIDIEDFTRQLDIIPQEHFAFQEAQARAHASGVIATEVAQIIYNALGEVQSNTNGGWQSHVTLARKVTITNLMGQLYGRV